VSCPEFIRYNYFLYIQLLVRYLEHKYHSKKDAKQKYFALMRLMSEMQYFRHQKDEFIKEWDMEHIPPIILELYDLI